MTPLLALVVLLLGGLTVLGIWFELIETAERRQHEDALRAMHGKEYDEVDEAFVDAWMVIARERGFPSTDDQ